MNEKAKTVETFTKCPVCSSRKINLFFTLHDVPVHCNVLFESREEALAAPCGNIHLGYCADCGHIYNFAFDPGRMKYSQDYENSLHFSPRFREYADNLAESLVSRYNLHGKDIIEIGCGKGDFLNQLCLDGRNNGTGFDPSFEPGREGITQAGNLIFIRDFYGEKYARYQADMICCRHVLEHIKSPRDFMQTLKNTIGEKNSIVFFEVPNVRFTLEGLAIWDIIYEHCSYFSAQSLVRLFELFGFKVEKLQETFAGQFLTIEAHVSQNGKKYNDNYDVLSASLKATVNSFVARYEKKVSAWKKIFKSKQRDKERGVVWGAGSKGVSFLNAMAAEAQIDYIVDINPEKQGKFIPGSGQQIVSPGHLQNIKPDYVIIMNPIYKDEISNHLASMHVNAQILVDDANIEAYSNEMEQVHRVKKFG